PAVPGTHEAPVPASSGGVRGLSGARNGTGAGRRCSACRRTALAASGQPAAVRTPLTGDTGRGRHAPKPTWAETEDRHGPGATGGRKADGRTSGGWRAEGGRKRSVRRTRTRPERRGPPRSPAVRLRPMPLARYG